MKYRNLTPGKKFIFLNPIMGEQERTALGEGGKLIGHINNDIGRRVTGSRVMENLGDDEVLVVGDDPDPAASEIARLIERLQSIMGDKFMDALFEQMGSVDILGYLDSKGWTCDADT